MHNVQTKVHHPCAPHPINKCYSHKADVIIIETVPVGGLQNIYILTNALCITIQ